MIANVRKRLEIVLTSAPQLPKPDRQHCFDAALQDYVAKPIDFPKLLAALGKAKVDPDFKTAI